MTAKTSSHTALKLLALVTLVILMGVASYYVLNAPDKRDDAQKISDAINELPNGVDKAARQLQRRTPGQKLNDAMQDSSDDIKKATNQQ